MNRRQALLLGTAALLPAWLLAQDDKPPRGERKGPRGGPRKPEMADTIAANIYADNWFEMYINGELVCVDPIRFLPHNVVSIDLLPTYPMTIAIKACDNADPKTGLEYANTHIGDGGLILKFADGTITDASWKALAVSRGPIDRDMKTPRVENLAEPEGWTQPGFDDSKWAAASVYSEEKIRPKKPFYEHDFKGASFIWSSDLDLDNTVLFRKTLTAPPDGKARPDFSKLNEQRL
ncbi:MAG: hypothetical protein RL095_4166 [Verrucomicrobiota bacterium]|jgi:hypothetical protein